MGFGLFWRWRGGITPEQAVKVFDLVLNYIRELQIGGALGILVTMF